MGTTVQDIKKHKQSIYQDKMAIYKDRIYIYTPNSNGLGNFMRKDLWELAKAYNNTAEATWYVTLPEDEVEWIYITNRLISDILHKKLQEAADEEKRSVSSLIRSIVKEYLKSSNE